MERWWVSVFDWHTALKLYYLQSSAYPNLRTHVLGPRGDQESRRNHAQTHCWQRVYRLAFRAIYLGFLSLPVSSQTFKTLMSVLQLCIILSKNRNPVNRVWRLVPGFTPLDRSSKVPGKVQEAQLRQTGSSSNSWFLLPIRWRRSEENEQLMYQMQADGFTPKSLTSQEGVIL